MKKVIFIGGTSFSGSTFFDMILSNDPEGFSCGEVDALFYPYRSHHINPLCGCANRRCDLWQRVLSAGVKNVYNTIFNLFPNIKFIVDSSKNPYWISSQTKNLMKERIESKHILIWKTPLEIAYSYEKRGEKNWYKHWINYHRLYLTAVENWRAVKYSELTNNPNIIKKLCEYIQIPYFSTKSNYWEKEHHTIFGNVSAKIHLHPKNLFDKNIEKPSNYNFDRYACSIEDLHRTIYYTRINDHDLEKRVKLKIEGDKKIQRILDALDDRDILYGLNGKYPDDHLRLSRFYFVLRKVKRIAFLNLMKIRYCFLNSKASTNMEKGNAALQGK